MAGIRFQNVKKTYDNGITVIEDLNLKLRTKNLLYWWGLPAAVNPPLCV